MNLDELRAVLHLLEEDSAALTVDDTEGQIEFNMKSVMLQHEKDLTELMLMERQVTAIEKIVKYLYRNTHSSL